MRRILFSADLLVVLATAFAASAANPTTIIPAPEFHSHVLGGQVNLWTEYIPNLRQVQYMMFPGLGALSEMDWSPKQARDWESFKAHAALNEKRLEALGVNYRPLSKPD
ncbi:MAG TPA: family 20 glycosylhydrolase [Verrucomicrobiae bacterium]|nr:family 20 glycosylhydrolase [Verrucomicrobiae bacterium]